MRQRYVDLIVRPEARDIAYAALDGGAQRPRLAAQPRVTSRSRRRSSSWSTAGRTRGRSRPTSTPTTSTCTCASRPSCTSSGSSSAGMEQVFELGRQFRNEGADSTHNPEFTSLEVYETYGDYDSMRLLTQELIQEAATAVYGAPVARRPRRRRHRSRSSTCPATGPRIPICTAVSTPSARRSPRRHHSPELQRHARAIGLDLDPGLSWGVGARGGLRRAVRGPDDHAGVLHRLPARRTRR